MAERPEDLTPEDLAHDPGVRRAMADLARAGCGMRKERRDGPFEMCFKPVVITVTSPGGLPMGLCKAHAQKYHPNADS